MILSVNLLDVQGTILEQDGQKLVCYDSKDRVELLGTLALCNSYKDSFHKCNEALSDISLKVSPWVWFALGIGLGATGGILIERK